MRARVGQVIVLADLFKMPPGTEAVGLYSNTIRMVVNANRTLTQKHKYEADLTMEFRSWNTGFRLVLTKVVGGMGTVSQERHRAACATMAKLLEDL